MAITVLMRFLNLFVKKDRIIHDRNYVPGFDKELKKQLKGKG